MAIANTTKSKVLFGNELQRTPPLIQEQNAPIVLSGKDNNGQIHKVPLTKAVLSKHIMLLGGIGTGKTNAFLNGISAERNHDKRRRYDSFRYQRGFL